MAREVVRVEVMAEVVRLEVVRLEVARVEVMRVVVMVGAVRAVAPPAGWRARSASRTSAGCPRTPSSPRRMSWWRLAARRRRAWRCWPRAWGGRPGGRSKYSEVTVSVAMRVWGGNQWRASHGSPLVTKLSAGEVTSGSPLSYYDRYTYCDLVDELLEGEERAAWDDAVLERRTHQRVHLARARAGLGPGPGGRD